MSRRSSQLNLFADPHPSTRGTGRGGERPRIRIGTASWTDPGFVADWYPGNLPAAARLSWYAEHFDYVEVNSSFYAIPQQRTIERWDDETPDDFLFDVKLHRLLSRHVAAADTLPPDLRAHAKTNARGNVVLDCEIERLLVERIQTEFAPLREAGKIGAFLLQLSPSFSPRKHQLAELESIFVAFANEKLAVELRNRDWMESDLREKTLNYFRERGIPMVLVDAPVSKHFTVMPGENVITDRSLAYLRLHGRNERGYITGKSVAERFDYDYSDKEIDEIAGRVRRLATEANEVHVAFNNNRSSYAPKAALNLKRVLAS